MKPIGLPHIYTQTQTKIFWFDTQFLKPLKGQAINCESYFHVSKRKILRERSKTIYVLEKELAGCLKLLIVRRSNLDIK